MTDIHVHFMCAHYGAQGRVAFSNRKPVVTTSYLRVTAPFHSAMATQAAAKIGEDVARLVSDAQPTPLASFGLHECPGKTGCIRCVWN